MKDFSGVESILEYGSNLADVNWRLSNLYRIQNKDGIEVPFIPNAVQRHFISNCGRSDLILKARQLGFTTLCSIIGLDEAIFYDDWRVGIIAHTQDDAIKIFSSKVKFPYDHLPEAIRTLRPAKNERAGFLSFAHGSEIGVSVSARGGTFQRLHISEFGKICAKYPEKAREIVTGSFPAVGKNPKTIESTAEGQEGYFYQYAMDAMVGKGGFRLHFYPWWSDPGNSLKDISVCVTEEQEAYFSAMESEIERVRKENDGTLFSMYSPEEKVRFTDGQKRWWVSEEYLLGGDMKREHPCTPEEAFSQAIEGSYFTSQLHSLEKKGRIGVFPADPNYEVHSFWDLGRNDMTAVWLMQWIRSRARFVGYFENSGEHIGYYFHTLKDWCRMHDVAVGDVYWPHDGRRESLFLEKGTLGIAEELGYRPVIVKRSRTKIEAIQQARKIFPNCDFDEKGCLRGIRRLKQYRKDWDDIREVWRDRPRHDDNSHCADAFMTFTSGWNEPSQVQLPEFKPRSVA